MNLIVFKNKEFITTELSESTPEPKSYQLDVTLKHQIVFVAIKQKDINCKTTTTERYVFECPNESPMVKSI